MINSESFAGDRFDRLAGLVNHDARYVGLGCTTDRGGEKQQSGHHQDSKA